MTRLPAYIDGKRAITLPSRLRTFCPSIRCCQDLPSSFPVLLQLETGTSGGPVVLHCITVTLTKVNLTTWQGSFGPVADCIQGRNGGAIDIEFTCNDVAPVDPQDCLQVFGMSIEGDAIDEDSCCCFDSNPALTGVGAGDFCLEGGLGTLWPNARLGDGTGCNCGNTWEEIDASDGSFSRVWSWVEDEYGDTCCDFSPDADDCCPDNPSSAMGGSPAMAMRPPQEVEEWLNGISE